MALKKNFKLLALASIDCVDFVLGLGLDLAALILLRRLLMGPRNGRGSKFLDPAQPIDGPNPRPSLLDPLLTPVSDETLNYLQRLLHFANTGSGYCTIVYHAVLVIQTVRVFNRSVEDFDLHVLRFTDYGKEFPKAHNMSPDAFIQLALQLTYYKSVTLSGVGP